MADTKISSATNTTALVSTDMFPLARSADTTARKVTFANLFADTDTDIAAANALISTANTNISTANANIATLDTRIDALEAAAPPASSPLGQTYLVAADDAPASVIASANYVCDGTADEVQINAALTALLAFGGVVRLSEGTFNVAAPVLVVEASTTLIGAGVGTHDAGTQAGRGTMIKATAGFTGAQVMLVQLTADDKPLVGASIRDLSVNGSDVAADGIVFRSNFGRLLDCHVTNCTDYGVRVKGYAAWTTYDARIVNCMVSFCGTGILMDSDSADGHIISCVLQQNTLDGIEIQSGSIQMIGGQYYGNTRYNIFFNNAGSNSMVNGIKIENAGQHGIFIDSTTTGPTGIIISGCGFRLNGKTTNNTYDHIAAIGTAAIANLTITGNRFSSSPSTDADLPRYGVNLGGNYIQNATIVGNTFARPTATHFGTAAINYGPGSSNANPSLCRGNAGAPSYGCRGTGVVTAAATSVNVTHNLAYTPNTDEFNITPTNIPTNAPLSWAVTAASSTTFTLTLSGVPGASTFTFTWQAG